jgi:hypothetical protein
MARSPRRHWTRFWVAARHWFGFNQREAKVLLAALQEHTDFDVAADRLSAYLPDAADLFDDVEERVEDQEEGYRDTYGTRAPDYPDDDYTLGYELDPTWGDEDEWLEADEWWEITAEYEEANT